MWSSWKRCNTHVYQVSSPCVLPLASLRSKEFKRKVPEAQNNNVVVVDTMYYACVPRFISMRVAVGKLE